MKSRKVVGGRRVALPDRFSLRSVSDGPTRDGGVGTPRGSRSSSLVRLSNLALSPFRAAHQRATYPGMSRLGPTECQRCSPWPMKPRYISEGLAYLASRLSDKRSGRNIEGVNQSTAARLGSKQAIQHRVDHGRRDVTLHLVASALPIHTVLYVRYKGTSHTCTVDVALRLCVWSDARWHEATIRSAAK